MVCCLKIMCYVILCSESTFQEFGQLLASHPRNCLIRLDVGTLIMTAAAVLQSGGNDPLIAFLLTCVSYFGAAFALQAISIKQRVYCRLISTQCGCQMALQQQRIYASRAFVDCFWCDNCEISTASLFVRLEMAAFKCALLVSSEVLLMQQTLLKWCHSVLVKIFKKAKLAKLT